MTHSEKQPPADPLAENPPLMPAGSKYVGQPADVSSRRSLTLWKPSGEPDQIDPQQTEMIADQFYHEGEFWRAMIPLDGVERIFGQAFNFSEIRTRVGKDGREVIFNKRGLPKRKIPFLYHVQCRFCMKSESPIRLYPLGTTEFGEPSHQVDDCVYSLEALGPIGWDFNLKAGLSGDLIVAHRFMSVTDMVFERIVVENQWVVQMPELPLDSAQRRELLVRSVIRSHRSGLSQRYFLYRCCGTNNCTSNPFQLLDEVVPYKGRYRCGAMFYRLPFSPRRYLRMRGLDTDPQAFFLVRDEFSDFINDPQTQKRKREYVRRLIRQRRAQKESETAQ